MSRRAAVSVAAAAVLGAAGGIPAAQGGDADSLRDRNAAIAAQARSAELELYALQSQLDAARSRLDALAVRSAEIATRRGRVQTQLRVARTTLQAAETFLGTRLRLLYEEGQTDPLEVLLGSTSLEAAMSDLDGLQFAAQQDREIIERTLAARGDLQKLGKRLAAESARLAQLRDALAAEAARLEAAASERAQFVARLASERNLNARRIRALEAQVEAARIRTERISETAPPAAVAEAAPAALPTPTPSGGRTLTVVATAYALPGRTATGIPVGWGVVAVDPSVIPLGTRMTIPGYGEGVAADTGSAVKGAKIDLWFPTTRQAFAWGVRTVTITLH